MKKMKEYKYHAGIVMRGYPNYKQKTIVKMNGGSSNFVHNRLVAVNNELYNLCKVGIYLQPVSERIEKLMQCRDAKGIMNAAPFLYDMDSGMVANAIKNYKAAWKNCKERHTGVPTFHKKGNSYRYQTNPHYKGTSKGMNDCSGVYFVDENHIVLPKIGKIRIKGSDKRIRNMLNRKAETRLGTTTITLDEVGKLYISIQLGSDEPFVEKYDKTGALYSFDLNLSNFLTDCYGNVIDNPRYLKNSEIHLKKMQRKLSKKGDRAKKEGRKLHECVEYQKLRRKVASLHKHVANQRLDFQNRTASSILKNHDVVFAENLKVSNMKKNHKLAKAISDVSWGQFLHIMEVKAAMHGKTFVKVPPKNTTQICSVCGHNMKGEVVLGMEEWTCPCCGTHHIRDYNAAKNIMKKGLELHPEMQPGSFGNSRTYWLPN